MPGGFSQDAQLQQLVEQFVEALVNWNSGADPDEAEPSVNWNSHVKPAVNWNSGAGPTVNWNSSVDAVAEMNLNLILDAQGNWYIVQIQSLGSLIPASEAVQSMMDDVEKEFLFGATG